MDGPTQGLVLVMKALVQGEERRLVREMMRRGEGGEVGDEGSGQAGDLGSLA